MFGKEGVFHVSGRDCAFSVFGRDNVSVGLVKIVLSKCLVGTVLCVFGRGSAHSVFGSEATVLLCLVGTVL